MPAFDVDALRAEFPALAREQDGRPVAFLDGPGGTQVPQRVIDAVVGYYSDIERQRRRRVRDERRSATRSSTRPTRRSPTSSAPRSPDEIKFGYNMSTLTLHIGRSIGATLGPGDEIVVTTLDHEANVSTWEAMAADRGVTVHTGRHPPGRRDARPRGPRVEARRRGPSSSRSATPATRSARSTRSRRSSPARTRSGR